jgi:hypothetical protein
MIQILTIFHNLFEFEILNNGLSAVNDSQEPTIICERREIFDNVRQVITLHCKNVKSFPLSTIDDAGGSSTSHCKFYGVVATLTTKRYEESSENSQHLREFETVLKRNHIPSQNI